MRPLSLCVAVISLLALVAVWHAPDLWTPIVAGAALVCAVTTFRSTTISSFLRLLVATFACEVVIFGGLLVAKKFDLLPAAWLEYMPPESFVVGAAIFSVMAYAVSFIPITRVMMRITDLYFDAPGKMAARLWPLPRLTMLESTLARTMLVAVILINQAQVAITVRLSFFNRDWFNALQAKNQGEYWHQLLAVFVPWVAVYIASIMLEYAIQQQLILRWRRFLTARYVDRWLEGSTHYRISLMSEPTDNPDQRISEDVSRFVTGDINGGDWPSNGIYFFTIQLIFTLSRVISFSVILWTISSNFTVPGTDFVLPGFLFWAALLYTVIGTGLTHIVGRKLIPLYFDRQRFEADFRFSLARNREYAEQVALLGGEPQERRFLMRRFGTIFANVQAIIRRYVQLLALRRFYDQISSIIPYILTAPYFFLGKITLGVMTQTAEAFNTVQDGFSFFVTYYKEIAEFRSVLLRLTSFEDAILKAHALGPSAVMPAEASSAIEVRELGLALPDGRAIVSDASFRLPRGEDVLVTGPSGSGKSTLFRALAGVWPFKTGDILVPADNRILLLPQQPYFPIGTLRSALAYPHAPETYEDARFREVLAAVELGGLQAELDVENNWGQRLSGGEQQRVAIARALLARPDWLLLDESTSALDPAMEARMYTTLRANLPETTLVSIGHRDTLRTFHARSLVMQPAGPGLHRPVGAPIQETAAE